MQFDSSLKFLLDRYPEGWLRLVGVPDVAAEPLPGEDSAIQIRDSDLSTVTAQADKVFRIKQAEPWILHIEVQSGYAASLPDRVLLYNTLLVHRTKLPVRSVVVLLAPKADGPAMTGIVTRRLPGQSNDYLTFRYDIIRLWQLPREAMLSGGPGMAPLAPLADVSAEELADVFREIDREIVTAANTHDRKELAIAAYLLAGLRFPSDFVDNVVRTVVRRFEIMRESSTFQAILNEGIQQGRQEGRQEGAVDEARKLLLSIGRKRLGEPDNSILELIDGISHAERLEELALRVDDVDNWNELLATE